jgi:mono/diheme cytochrome c family protein
VTPHPITQLRHSTLVTSRLASTVGALAPRSRHWLGTALVGACVVSFTACGGAGGGDDSALSEAGRRGRDISNSNGCAGCHGGDGGVGPSWDGLYGSEVKLADGTTVTADEAYLTRAIVEPNAEIVEGYVLKMPSNDLSDDEVADVIAYIRELGADPATTTTP